MSTPVRIPGLPAGRVAAAALLLALACLLALAGGAFAAAPQVTAPSAAVIEASTGTVVFAKNAEQRRGMASTTKLMTALVAVDEAPLGKRVTAIDYNGSALETKLGLIGGERMSVGDLVRAMMLPSANDAAQTLAVRLGGSKGAFADLMNAKADELGLDDTNFTNAIGLDAPGHRSSALDLAKLGVAVHNNPFLRGVIRQPRITLNTGARERTIVNRNRVLGTKLPGGGVIDGMKTGHTQRSGYALVGSATRGGVTLVSVVLGDPSEAARDADTAALLRWASGLFVKRTIVPADANIASVAVERGKEERVRLVPARALERVVPRAARVELEPVDTPRLLEAPVAAGTQAGVARVLVNGREVARVPVQTAAAVERRGLVSHVAHTLADHWQTSLLALALLLGGTLTLLRALHGSRAASARRRAPDAPPRSSAP